MDALRQDIRLALRSLRNHLSVTSLAIVSLALAIAGNTVVFSLINGLLYRPLPRSRASRCRARRRRPNLFASDPTFFDTMGISLVRGRLLQDRDGAENEPVAVINQALAERHWEGSDPHP